MKATVDSARCQGHARCNLFAPEVFDFDDDGHALVLTPVVPPEYEDGVRQAAENCPESAISLH